MKITFDKLIVIITVVTAALLQLIDTSIVNVTLTQMMGNLGASLSDISWVVTGYAAANVVMISLSGWLSAKIGRKTYFTASIILFTIASVFCGMSTTVTQLVFFRIIQGIGGGGLMSTSQAILIDTFPREDIGMANAIFVMGVVVGPSIGPTLGGYLTDHLSWHWVFFINIPFGIIAAILSMLYITESPHKMKVGRMDWLALILLVIFIGAMQIVLEKGESEDWFETRYITILTIASVLAGVLFVWRQLTIKNPILNLKLMKNYQFALGSMFSFIQGFGLYASVFIIPVFCQSMLGYTSQDTGLLLLPSSLATGFMMPIVGAMMKNNRVSPPLMAAVGFALFVLFVYQLSGMNLNTGAEDFFIPLLVRGIGMGLLNVPLTTITVFTLHSRDIPQGTALLNTLRQLGGSFGIAIATTLINVRTAFHYARLSDYISIYNQPTYSRINSITGQMMGLGKDQATSQMIAAASIKGEVVKQSLLLSYNDIFLIVGIFFAACIPLLLLFRIKGKNIEKIERKVEMHIAE